MIEEFDVAETLAKYATGKSSWDDPYQLMSRQAGKDVGEFDHMLLSLVDILVTPIGTRCGMREYGSNVFTHLDHNITQATFIDIYSDVAIALQRWEPRLRVTHVGIDGTSAMQGVIAITIKGIYLLEGRGVTLRNVVLDFKPRSA